VAHNILEDNRYIEVLGVGVGVLVGLGLGGQGFSAIQSAQGVSVSGYQVTGVILVTVGPICVCTS